MSKKDWVLKALQGEKVDKVPVGFWFHFLDNEGGVSALVDKSLRAQNINGHKQFVEKARPDFVKLMSDGYFLYPNESLKQATSAEDLLSISSIGKEHAWIREQVSLVQEIIGHFPEEIAGFYNIFSPATYFKFAVGAEVGNQLLTNFIKENPEAIKHALTVIAQDVALLAEAVIKEGGADGIYFSTQTLQDARASAEEFRAFIEPADRLVLDVAEKASGVNILHICGYEGATNELTLFQHYPTKVINYAANVEDLPIEQSRAFFSGKTILGGFDNTVNGELASADKGRIQEKTKELLAKIGDTSGFVLGADCTIPKGTSLEIFDWVREVV